MSNLWKLGKLTRRRSDGTSYWSYTVTWWTAAGRVRRTLDTQDKPTAEAKARKAYAERDKSKPADVATVGACVVLYLDSAGATMTRSASGKPGRRLGISGPLCLSLSWMMP